MTIVNSVQIVLSAVAHVFLRKGQSRILADRLIRTIHYIVATLEWWPRFNLDGGLSARCLSPNYTKTSMSLLRSQAQKRCLYVDLLHHINIEIISLIDKPNAHRLVELVSHTIPILFLPVSFQRCDLKSSTEVLKGI